MGQNLGQYVVHKLGQIFGLDFGENTEIKDENSDIICEQKNNTRMKYFGNDNDTFLKETNMGTLGAFCLIDCRIRAMILCKNIRNLLSVLNLYKEEE